VSKCDTSQKVKADYMKPMGLLQPLSILEWEWDEADYMEHVGLLQPLSILEWEWDDISMDFIMGLPLTARKFDSNLVTVDRLTKFAHFIPVNTNYNTQRYAEIYIARVLCLYRVPKMIISNRGSQFVTHYWEQLYASLRTHLIHSLAYHPQMDGQTE
jgi:hypothetical protein